MRPPPAALPSLIDLDLQRPHPLLCVTAQSHPPPASHCECRAGEEVLTLSLKIQSDADPPTPSSGPAILRV
ncbi:hypothetical protein CgunFtcFv8_012272 [Champsocephalus gunnari]|uniref:Uncharacterized protein n=1 Tax=Champsocephalus gunnari TaxID=52237 RepID=A0AAN8HJA0_CHAGU|nr:hypothetical protein CgunFtcFv8_012272 [Champsocephalus gunnari]